MRITIPITIRGEADTQMVHQDVVDINKMDAQHRQVKDDVSAQHWCSELYDVKACKFSVRIFLSDFANKSFLFPILRTIFCMAS